MTSSEYVITLLPLTDYSTFYPPQSSPQKTSFILKGCFSKVWVLPNTSVLGVLSWLPVWHHLVSPPGQQRPFQKSPRVLAHYLWRHQAKFRGSCSDTPINCTHCRGMDDRICSLWQNWVLGEKETHGSCARLLSGCPWVRVPSDLASGMCLCVLWAALAN